MEFFDVVATRRSVRNYLQQPVAREDVISILKCASCAPSAKNRQPWKFIVVTSVDVKRRVFEATKNQHFILEAPVIIVAIADDCDHVSTNGNISHLVDLAIAGEHIALGATALGLGTCWLAAFYQEKMRAELNVPQSAYMSRFSPLVILTTQPLNLLKNLLTHWFAKIHGRFKEIEG